MAFSTFNSGQALYGQSGSYTALGDRQFIKANAVTSGVRQIKTPVANVKQGDLAVQGTGGGAAVGNVQILAGDCWVAGASGLGFFYAYNDATITQAISAAPSARTDVIYVQVDNTSGTALVTLQYSAGGTVPTTTSTIAYLPLASIAVPAGFTSGTAVQDSWITDTRKKAQLMDLSVANTSSVATATTGNVIYDTSASTVKAYNGSAWDSLLQSTTTGALDSTGNFRYLGTIVSTSANTPASPQAGQIWYQSDTGLSLLYNGTAWVQMSTTSSFVTGTVTIKQGVTLTTSSNFYKYVKMGRYVYLSFQCIASSAGTASNSIQVIVPASTTLPTPAGSSPAGASSATVGTFWFGRSAGNLYYTGATIMNTGATSTTLTFYTSGGTSTFGVNPAITFASGDFITGNIWYETSV